MWRPDPNIKYDIYDPPIKLPGEFTEKERQELAESAKERMYRPLEATEKFWKPETEKASGNTRIIVSQFHVPGEGMVLALNGPAPMIPYRKYRIDGEDFEPVIVYDLPLCIGIHETGDYVGKTVEFVAE